jgi:YD repeat-containing protein
MADPPEPPANPEVEAVSSEQLEAAMRAKEAELAVAEEEFAQELATPAAEQEREASQTAYSQLTSSEASELLIEQFGPTIGQLNEDPGRLLTDMEVEKMLGPNAALVSSPTEGREIIEGSFPLLSEIGSEEEQPLDLTLEREGDSFVPANPAAPTALPATAEGEVEVGEGVRVQLPTTSDHEAVQVGEMGLFYPETQQTTDTMLAPVAGGVEVFAQLRSPESPEELRFDVQVPDGAELVATPGGGAQVVDSEGAELEEVPPPITVDAQGATVPTTMTVEGDSLVLSVDLAGSQVVYPALVDPLFKEEPTNFYEWTPSETAEYGYTQDASKLEVWSLGSGHNYGPYTHVQYTYATPGPTAWIEAASFSSISFFPNACGGNQPHGYIQLYNPGAARVENLGKWEGKQENGIWGTGAVGQPGTTWAQFGIGTDGVGTSLSCTHEFYLGAYSLQERDTTLPVVTSVSGVPLNQWFDPAKVGTATITAEDTGFGVYEISIGNEGGVTNRVRPSNCTGVSGSRCPHVYSWPINPAYVAGKRAFYANAQDAMGNNTASGFVGYAYADPNAPAVELTGQFARATDEVGFSEQGAHHPAGQNELSLPTYVLHINATDGSNATDQTMESGVQSVQVFLDGAEQPLSWGTQGCPPSENSCPLFGNYELKLLGLSAGVHKLKVVATDRVGHPREREIEFEFIPATGEGENQVLEHFPLHQVDEGAAATEETQPEVAVNVINGNVVFHQQDAEVATADAGLGIERYYNSELPQPQSGEFGTGWTLDDTPELEPGQGFGAGKATIIEGEGAVETAVPLPAQEGQQTFDPATQASIAKVAGGYTITDEGEGTNRTANLAASGLPVGLDGSAEATLDLEREGGELSEIAVDDPGTAAGDAEQAVTESTRGYLFEGSFGGAASAGGNLSRPVATATDSAGNVYVADAGHDRVQVFGPTGTFLRQWGGVGTGTGQFQNIVGIAVGGGNVYVAEPTRIEQFTSTGAFVRQITTGQSQISGLKAVSTDPSGRLWTLEQLESKVRLQTFSAEGVYSTFYEINVGASASAVFEPAALAVDASSNVWVADTGNNRVVEFRTSKVSPPGRHISSILTVGSAGAGAGQFNRPQGIALDPSGNVWVADTGNNRLEEFNSGGTFVRSTGSSGGNNLQFSQPLAIATDPSGNLWVADTRNDRVEKLTSAGAYSLQAGGAGSAGGNLARPVGAATDSAGNVYVADAGHDRVQEFNSSGTFVRQFGGAGTGAGQFQNIVGIAVGTGNNVYVAEPTRIEQFGPTGTFVRQIGSAGTGNGQFTGLRAITVGPGGQLWTLEQFASTVRLQTFSAEGVYSTFYEISEGASASAVFEPAALAVDASSNVWVADTGNNRVVEFRTSKVSVPGRHISSILTIGSAGAGTGQFNRPRGIALDPSGNVWATDTGNNRVQEFSAAGKPLARFGRVGGDAGQLSGPAGAATDASGNVWIANTYGDRIDKWTPSSPSSSPPIEPAPAADVTTSGGLVQSIEGAPTGSITYQHEATRLTGASTPEGTSHYVYDAQHRLQKIELPHGTSAEIGYDTIGRVITLKTVVEGAAAETTSFEYDPEGFRETVVRRPKKAAVHYAISEEGSVLKWWNTPKPPEIEELTGSLWAQRGEVNPGTITIGDQSLETKAYSPEGLHSIQIVANGSQVVAEKTCEKAHDFECLYLERIYVTETGNWPPGIVSFEVIATDTNGFTSGRRFWDNVPYTPPPGNAELEPPTFEAIQLFREEFGLDLDLKGNERGIAERIFNLVDAWHEPNTPEGQVARASMGRWGVPLRATDVAEMEYRERYTDLAAHSIPQWAEAHAQSSYAGYYINQRQGGRLHVGFTGGNQSQQLSQLVSEIGEIAPGRISTFELQPSYSYKQLLEAWRADSVSLGGQPVAKSVISQAIDMANNKVEVKAEDVAGMESFLLGLHLDLGKFEVVHATDRPVLKALNTHPAEYPGHPKYNVREAERRIFSGDVLTQPEGEFITECTASWGATAPAGIKPNGEEKVGRYLVTAGHCFNEVPAVSRFAREEGKYVEFPIGSVAASSYGIPVEGHETDAQAISLREGFSPPSWIFANKGSQLRPGAPAVPVIGEPVCHSGVEGGFSCGSVIRLTEQWIGELPAWVWETNISSCDGDSGGPYWQPEGNTPLGIEDGGPSHKLPDGRECGKPEYFTPLVESRAEEMGVLVGRNLGVFQALGMSGIPGLAFYGAVN